VANYSFRFLFYPLLLLSFLAQAQDDVIISSLTFEGNKITRERILMREMTIREGQSVPRNQLDYHINRSKGNVWNLQLFNFVEIDTCWYSENEIDVVVRVTERWYVWPVPFVEFADRNFSEWLETMRWDRLDYGTLIKWSNFRGRREELTLHLRFGYNNQYELRYEIPYLDHAQKWGIEFQGGYRQGHEVAYATVDNKRVFYKNPNRYIRKEAFGAITPRWRPNLYNVHKLEIGYTHFWILDSVAKLQPEYFGAGENLVKYFSLEYEVERDVTDYRDYPLKGYRFELRLRKDGFRIFDSPIDIWSLEVEYAKYWQLHKRWYFAHAQKIKVSSTNGQAYSLQKGLGYERDFVRGYEHYVIDGQHYGLLKTSLRWAILPFRKVKLKFLKSNKFNTLPLAFYANFNFDMGYVIDNQFNNGNPLAGSMLLGGGFGIDIVTFYDISWRAEYSMNKNLEHGFFLHFTKHI
jgi:outer membrane protein assembly factor BamA